MVWVNLKIRSFPVDWSRHKSRDVAVSFRDEHDSALARAKALSAFFEQNTWVISLAQLMKSHNKSGTFRMSHFLPVHIGVLLVFSGKCSLCFSGRLLIIS